MIIQDIYGNYQLIYTMSIFLREGTAVLTHGPPESQLSSGGPTPSRRARCESPFEMGDQNPGTKPWKVEALGF